MIREAMRGKGMVALGRIVLTKRERVIMIEPWHKGLTATTLRYPYEIRNAEDYFDEIPNVEIEPEMLQLAERILQNKATDFDPLQFVDRYEEALIELLNRKQAGIPLSREPVPSRPHNDVNLMEALRRSIAEGRAGNTPPRQAERYIERQVRTRPSTPRKRQGYAPKSMDRLSARQKKAG